MDIEAVAAAFKALGDPTRLRIFACLKDCCCPPAAFDEEGGVRQVDGPTVGEVCCRVTNSDKSVSTISFHLKEMRNAGLIKMEKRGRFMVCSLDQAALPPLQEFLDLNMTGARCCQPEGDSKSCQTKN